MNKQRLQTLAGMLNENTMFISNGIFEPQTFGQAQISPANGIHLTSSTYPSSVEVADFDDDYETEHSMHTYEERDFSPPFEGEEDELEMVKTDVAIMLDDLEDLHKLLCHLKDSGQDVNFPHWWQSKIIMAKDYIGKATDYLAQELKSY